MREYTDDLLDEAMFTFMLRPQEFYDNEREGAKEISDEDEFTRQKDWVYDLCCWLSIDCEKRLEMKEFVIDPVWEKIDWGLGSNQNFYK